MGLVSYVAARGVQSASDGYIATSELVSGCSYIEGNFSMVLGAGYGVHDFGYDTKSDKGKLNAITRKSSG